MWTDEKRQLLRDLWPDKSAAFIAEKVGKTRNAIIGLAHRMQLPPKKVRDPGGPRKRIPIRRPPVMAKVRVSAFIETPMPPLPNESSQVSILKATPHHCKAVIDLKTDPNGLAMVCGEPVDEGHGFEFCSYHIQRFTLKPRWWSDVYGK